MNSLLLINIKSVKQQHPMNSHSEDLSIGSISGCEKSSQAHFLNGKKNLILTYTRNPGGHFSSLYTKLLFPSTAECFLRLAVK